FIVGTPVIGRPAPPGDRVLGAVNRIHSAGSGRTEAVGYRKWAFSAEPRLNAALRTENTEIHGGHRGGFFESALEPDSVLSL
ncbi:MAG: hypothetical protein Q8N51_11905, partial [Gammaproteobacteria bacterium]|nr:hypothetical protein [Gammaproteobacteria bacterium]